MRLVPAPVVASFFVKSVRKRLGGKIYCESCSKSVVENTSGQTAVVAMMVDNGLSTLPNPVTIATDMELA